MGLGLGLGLGAQLFPMEKSIDLKAKRISWLLWKKTISETEIASSDQVESQEIKLAPADEGKSVVADEGKSEDAAETGVAGDDEEGKSPKKLLMKDICDSLIVAQALLELSHASDLKPPDMLPPELSNDNIEHYDANDIIKDVLTTYNDEENVEPYSPRVGDTVKLRSDDLKFRCYVVRVEKKEGDILTCNWYYYPEETKEGRLPFHGAMEVFSSGSTTVNCNGEV